MNGSGLHELELGGSLWRSFVADRSEATAFHDPAWAELLAECYGYRPFVLAVLDNQGEPLAGLPFLETKTVRRTRRWVSLPFTDMCEPLAIDRAATRALADGLEPARAEAGVKRLEVRSELEAPGASPSAQALSHVLHLEPDAEAVFRRLSRSQAQRNVARARRLDVVVRRGEGRADLDRAFFHLQTETRRRLGVPIQPRRFYSLLWDRMIEPNRGSLLLAYSGALPIAGAVFLHSQRTLTFKFGASLKSHWHLRGNALIFWTAIQQGCESGAETLDFGRTELDHGGLRTFKQNWGGRELPLSYTFFGTPSRRRSTGLAKSAVAGVIRHSPPFVCRAVGASLYKYA
jgi:CelD/BcsL family acetyltransferase involved in cellulose biosynthesis